MSKENSTPESDLTYEKLDATDKKMMAFYHLMTLLLNLKVLNGPPILSDKGLEYAKKAWEEGIRLTAEEVVMNILAFQDSIGMDNDKFGISTTAMIMHVQEIGIEEFTKEVEAAKAVAASKPTE